MSTLAEGAQQGEAALAVALLPVLSLTPAQELPLPGACTGDETWFEAVSLRPPLSLLGEPPVLSSRYASKRKASTKAVRRPSNSAFLQSYELALGTDGGNYLQLSRHR